MFAFVPLPSIHSTSLIPHTPPSCGGGGMGERALPPPPAVAWSQIVYNGDCAAPTHTDIYTYYRVRGSHVLLLSVCRSVGRLCACLWVWGCGCCPHSRYSGLCCCCCLATAAPLHQEAAVCIWQQQALNSIMPCLCVDAISHISGVCVYEHTVAQYMHLYITFIYIYPGLKSSDSTRRI